MAKKVSRKKQKIASVKKNNGTVASAPVAPQLDPNAIMQMFAQMLQGQVGAAAGVAPAAAPAPAPIVDNGFRNLVIMNDEEEVIHTVRHLPKELVGQVRRAFYRVLVQKLDYAIVLKTTMNGTTVDQGSDEGEEEDAE